MAAGGEHIEESRPHSAHFAELSKKLIALGLIDHIRPFMGYERGGRPRHETPPPPAQFGHGPQAAITIDRSVPPTTPSWSRSAGHPAGQGPQPPST